MEIDECLCQSLTGQLEKEPYLIQKLQMPVRYLSHRSMQVDGCINLWVRRAECTERRSRKVFHIKRLITVVFQERSNDVQKEQRMLSRTVLEKFFL